MSKILFEATPDRIRFTEGKVDTNRRYLRFVGDAAADFFLARGKTLGTGGGKLKAELPSGFIWTEPGYEATHDFAFPAGRGYGVTV